MYVGKPYKCDLDGNVFATNSNLKAHDKTQEFHNKMWCKWEVFTQTSSKELKLITKNTTIQLRCMLEEKQKCQGTNTGVIKSPYYQLKLFIY